MSFVRLLATPLFLLLTLPSELAAQTVPDGPAAPVISGDAAPAQPGTAPTEQVDPVAAARDAVSAVIVSCLAVAREPALCLPEGDAGRAAFGALSAEYSRQEAAAAKIAADEAARVAAEEAARIAAEEAARHAAEEAARIAAEEAARNAAEEAARVAAEEAARVAAETEAARIRAESEAAEGAPAGADLGPAEAALAQCIQTAGHPDAGVPVSEEAQQEALRALTEAQSSCAKAVELLPAAGPALFHLATKAQVDARHAEAVDLYSRAAAAGVVQAETRLGDYYLLGIGPIHADIDRALAHYQTASEAGEAAAQTTLALMYGLGRGVPRDPAKMVSLMRQAADTGYHFAQMRLAQIYLGGGGLPEGAEPSLGIPDGAEAARLLRAAAEQGNVSAALALADLYTTEGSGLPPDPGERFHWTDFAAKHGEAKAIAARAFLQEQGIGTDHDPEAAAAGYVEALETGKVSIANLRGTVNGSSPLWDRPTAMALQVILRDRKLYFGPLDGYVGGGTLAGLRRLAE